MIVLCAGSEASVFVSGTPYSSEFLEGFISLCSLCSFEADDLYRRSLSRRLLQAVQA